MKNRKAWISGMKFFCIIIVLLSSMLCFGCEKQEAPDFNIWIESGARYHCDAVCYFDGIGFLYQIDGAKPEDCRIALKKENDDSRNGEEVYSVSLQGSDFSYCLGIIRYRKGSRNYLGLSYYFHFEDERTQLFPEEIVWVNGAKIEEESPFIYDSNQIVTIRSFDAEKQAVEVSYLIDSPFPYEENVLPEELFSEKTAELTVSDRSIITIAPNGKELLVTPDRFFRLLELNYVGFCADEETRQEHFALGCYAREKDGDLLQFHEMPEYNALDQ